MNEHELHRLLDEAANDFTPAPSVGRLTVLLAAPRTAARRLPLILGVAAGLAAVAGGAAALTADQYAGWSPADQSVEIVVPDKLPVPGEEDPADVARPVDEHDAERDDAVLDAARRQAAERDAAARERRARREALELRKSITTIPPTHGGHDEPGADEFASDLIDAHRPAAATTTTEPKPEPPPTTEPKPEPKPEPEPEPKPEPPPTTEAPKPEPEPEPEPPAPTTTTTVPKEKEPPPTTEAPVEFTAKQVYGSCGEDPPYDVFHGTASPGTAIWIESPYGGAVTEADGSGHWEKKVYFESAPYNEAFTVVVESETGGRKEFTFVRTG